MPTPLFQHPLHRRREIQNEVEAICYLLSVRRSERRAVRIETATISRNRHDFGVLLQPLREALSGSIREEIDDTVQVQIDQNGSIVLAFAPSPIVDAQVANGKEDGCCAGFCRTRRRTVSSLVTMDNRARSRWPGRPPAT